LYRSIVAKNQGLYTGTPTFGLPVTGGYYFETRLLALVVCVSGNVLLQVEAAFIPDLCVLPADDTH